MEYHCQTVLSQPFALRHFQATENAHTVEQQDFCHINTTHVLTHSLV